MISVLEPLGSVTLGRYASVAAGPWCRLAGSDGPVARPPPRYAWTKERAGRAGLVLWLTGSWPNRLRGIVKPLYF
jgi:lipid-binding SYLF domain-containing protein